MTQKTRDDFKTENATALPTDGRNTAATVVDEFAHLADSAVFLEDLSDVATDGLLSSLDTGVTGSQLDDMLTKLDGIDDGAADDQTGAEIVAALDAELGSTDWQGGGGGSGSLNNIVEDTTPQLGGSLDVQTFNVGAATPAALTKLSQLTATATEINYSVGVTSGIQAQFTALAAAKANVSHTHAAADVTSGSFSNARISEASVIQHEGALTITESQISDFGTYLTTAAITFENLDGNGDVGDGSAQVAAGDHLHDGVYKVVSANETANVSAATASAAGKVELATSAEAVTGTDTTRAVTPAAMTAAMAVVPIVTVAASRTLIASDAGKVLRVTADATLTVDGAVFSAGQVVTVRVAGSDVTATIASGTATVTPVSGYDAAISVDRAQATLHFVSAGAADLSGGLDPS